MRDVFKGLDGKRYNSVAEACAAIEGFDWVCVGRPLFYHDLNGEPLGYAKKVANVWEHDMTPLGDVSPKYKRVQYNDCMEIATPLIETGGFYIVGGRLKNVGESAILVLESSDVMELGDGESIVNRIVLTSSHDGTGKIEFRVTPYLKKNGTAQSLDVPGLAFKHTLNVTQRMAKGRQAMRKIQGAWEDFTESAKRMQSVKLTDAEARSFIAEVLPSPKKEISTRLENLRADVYGIYKHTGIARTIPVCNGTLFGIVQAVAEFTDHHAVVRSSDLQDEDACNFDAKFLKSGAKKKAMALGVAKRILRMKGLER